ncbi:hypothetical protein [uncultured Akkermansia sp.]|uniref:hypothetical protein n=1 Tax=uncultured Akkermansia sp. TaxID=512294 RepID=UPI0026DDA8D7|nr:hypothetical protein [uncultured Akkermansia sp.]
MLLNLLALLVGRGSEGPGLCGGCGRYAPYGFRTDGSSLAGGCQQAAGSRYD